MLGDEIEDSRPEDLIVAFSLKVTSRVRITFLDSRHHNLYPLDSEEQLTKIYLTALGANLPSLM